MSTAIVPKNFDNCGVVVIYGEEASMGDCCVFGAAEVYGVQFDTCFFDVLIEEELY